jgi:hypothetical protein
MSNTLTPCQTTVLAAFNDFNVALDDQGLAVYVHHVAGNDMSSSGVRTRRVELERKGLVALSGSKLTKSNRSAATHVITSAGKKALRAVR